MNYLYKNGYTEEIDTGSNIINESYHWIWITRTSFHTLDMDHKFY